MFTDYKQLFHLQHAAFSDRMVMTVHPQKRKGKQVKEYTWELLRMQTGKW